MNRWQTYLCIGGLLLAASVSVFAQEELPTDDLGDVSDSFQENFFEALKQKGILNYERALEALENAKKSARGNPEQEAVVYFEMGKNHLALKQYNQAELALLESTKLAPDRIDVDELLYEVYFDSKAYEKAIPVVEKLIGVDKVYKEDLANLFVKTQRYQEALALIDELDQTAGRNTRRDSLRKRIINITGDVSSEITRLEGITDGQAATEQDFLELIYRYSTEGDAAKAEGVAERLSARFPDSDLVHLALYKFALERNDKPAAVASMKRILSAKNIDEKSKYKVLADFMDIAAGNPDYQGELDAAIDSFTSTVNSVALWQQLGDFFLDQQKPIRALNFYEKALSSGAQDYKLIKNTLLLQIDNQQFEKSLALSETALEVYPAQALLYLLKGVSLMGTNKSKEAIEVLEEGVDYVIDDANMERDFYTQLSKAYFIQGDAAKAQEYSKKAKDLGTP